MNIQRGVNARVARACFVCAVSVAACAADPGKKLTTAETELTSEQHTAIVEKNRKAEIARTEAADKALTTSSATDAPPTVAAERRDFDVRVKERLRKADARARDLRTRSEKLVGPRSSSFRTHYTTFAALRGQAATKVVALALATDSDWASQREEFEKKLDAIEAALDRMEEDL